MIPDAREQLAAHRHYCYGHARYCARDECREAWRRRAIEHWSNHPYGEQVLRSLGLLQTV